MNPAILRIVHLNTERTWRGGERQTFWLARELQRLGHENWIACRPGSPLEQQSQSVKIKTVPLSPWGEMDLLSARRLRRFMKNENIDVLHAHTGHAVGLGALASWRSGVRFLATRRVDFQLKRNFLSRWKYGRLQKVVAISEKIKSVLLNDGVPLVKIGLIPSGIDPSGYPMAAERGRLRAQKGFSEKDILVVQSAALEPHKDQKTLIRAALIVCGTYPQVKFLVLGAGSLKVSLESEVKALGLKEQVQFLGHRPDVLDFIALADVFVLSSKEEGLGTSLLDALAIGVPTVATRAGGIPEIYGAPEAPELVQIQNPQALAAGILSVLNDPSQAQSRVVRGKERVLKFSVQQMAQNYLSVYQELRGDKK